MIVYLLLLFARLFAGFASVEATKPRTPFSIICKINLHTSKICSTFAFGNRGGRFAKFLPAPGAFTFCVLLYVFRICKMIKLLLTFSFFQMLKIKHFAPSAVVHRHAPHRGCVFYIEFVRLISSLILLRGLFHPAHADAIVRNNHHSICKHARCQMTTPQDGGLLVCACIAAMVAVPAFQCPPPPWRLCLFLFDGAKVLLLFSGLY